MKIVEDNLNITERLWRFFFLYSPRLFQAQRSTVEHTQVLEESAEGIQV